MSPPKAYLFDVFGTIVNWRHSLTTGLMSHAASSLATSTPPPSARHAATLMTYTHWESLAVAWHTLYIRFSASHMAGISTWVDNDTVHMRSLHRLLPQYNLVGLWTPQQLEQINLLWHQLAGWADSAPAISALNAHVSSRTATLSNGSRPLLEACLGPQGANVPFGRILCSDDFRAYKPEPRVYRAAARIVMGAQADGGEGLDADADADADGGGEFEYADVVLVAAHLPDLRAAKAQGLRTVYVPRPLEEALGQEEVDRIRAEGRVVDLWLDGGVEGLHELVRRLDELQ